MTPEDYIRLVEVHFPRLEIRAYESIEMGWDYFVLDVNDELIFRFPRRSNVIQQLEWEAEILPMLAEALPVEVPDFKYVVNRKSAEPSMFVGYPKIQGSGLDAQKLEESDARKPVARRIGEALSALHAISLDSMNDHPMSENPEPREAEGWRDVYRGLFQFAEEHVFPQLSHEARSREMQTWQEFLFDESNFDFSPVLVHQDLNTEHVIIDYESGTVAGIIDWGDCGIGDAALDFVGLAQGMGENFALEVLDNYQFADPGIMSRARFYEVVVPYHYVRFDHESGSDKFREQGIRAIETRST